VRTIREGSRSQNRMLYKALARRGSAVESLFPTADANYTFLGSEGTLFWFFTDRDAPRGRVVAVDLAKPRPADWKEVVPEAAETIAANSAVGGNALGVFGGQFVLMYIKEGRAVIRVFDRTGRLEYEPALPTGGLIWGGFSGRQRDPEVFYQFLGLTEIGTIYRLDLEKKRNTVVQRAAIPIDPEKIAI